MNENPQIVDRGEMIFAGLQEHYTAETCGGIPSQWIRFAPHLGHLGHLGHIPGRVGSATCGVCFNATALYNMDYLCAVEVTGEVELAAELTSLRIPAQQYAVLAHGGHISEIRQVWDSIRNTWMPASGYAATGGPEFELIPKASMNVRAAVDTRFGYPHPQTGLLIATSEDGIAPDQRITPDQTVAPDQRSRCRIGGIAPNQGIAARKNRRPLQERCVSPDQ